MAKTHIEQISDYIKKNLKKGYTLDSLKYSLISQGYTKISVESAIELASKQMAQEIPEMKEKPQITYKVLEEDFEEWRFIISTMIPQTTSKFVCSVTN